MSGRGRSTGARHRAPEPARLVVMRRLVISGTAVTLVAAVVAVISMSGGVVDTLAPPRPADGPSAAPVRTPDDVPSPVAGSFLQGEPSGSGGTEGAGAGDGTAAPAGAGPSSGDRPDPGGSDAPAAAEDRSDDDRSGPPGAGGTATAGPAISAVEGPDGSFTVGSGAADWLVLAAGANGTVTRASDPQVRLGYEQRNGRLWRDGPFRIGFTGGEPVRELQDTPRWLLLAADGGRVELTVPALDRPRRLLLYVGGADAVVTAGAEREVVPGADTATVTVALGPTAGPTTVTLTPASPRQGHHIGIAAVELR